MVTSAWILALTLNLQAAPPPAPQPPARTSDRPLTGLFSNLVHDIRALPSKESARIASVSLGSAAVLHQVDDNIALWAKTAGPSNYTVIGRVAGDAWVQCSAALMTYTAGLLISDSNTTHLGSDLIRGQALNGLITQGLKVSVDRTRPSGGGHSFPSGHSSASFVTAVILQRHFGWEAGVPAYAAAGFISWTRLRDQSHWLTDVVVGSAIGMIVGRTVTREHEDAARWNLDATISKTSAAFIVTRR